MKRILVSTLGPPEVMQLEEVEDLQPGPGQVLMRIKAAGVNPVDTYVRAGLYGYSPKLPYTPGADGAGLVEAVGPGVDGIAVGQRVYGARCASGAYAEQAIFDAVYVFPLPHHVSFEQGASIGIPYTTAYGALFLKAKVQPGETVLVHGASGGVGTAAVQLARAAHLVVIGTAGSEAGRRLCQELGAVHVLDHRDPKHFEQAVELTQGRGVDVILEMLANENLGRDLTVLAPFGRIVVIGSRGTVSIDPREAMFREATILGTRLRHLTPDGFRDIHAQVVEGLTRGTLRPIVGKALALAHAPEAHDAVMRPPAYGNIVLIPG